MGEGLKRNLMLVALVFFISFGVYANSTPNGFVWDDKNLILNNPDIKAISLSNIKTIFTHDIIHFMDRSNFYRPLQSLSYMADRFLWGKDPAGYHIANALLHSLNSVLIFILLLMLLRNSIAGFFGALFFAVHPLQTSAVTYIAGRADLLALFFLLVSTLFLFKHEEDGGMPAAAFCAAAFILALASKELCVVFPAFAGLYLFWKKSPKGSAAVFYTLLAVALIYLALRLTVLKFAPFGSQAINAPPLSRRLLLLAPVLATYLRLIILPYDLRMDRDINIPLSIFDTAVIASLIALGVLAFLFWKPAKKESIIRIGLAWFFIFLFPSMNLIVPLNAPISEHWLYIPFFGVSILAACAINWIYVSLRISASLRVSASLRGAEFFSRRRSNLLMGTIAAILVLLMCCYAAVTVYVNGFWKDEKTLFSYIARYKEVHFRAHYNLGAQYLEARKYREAIEEFDKVLKKAPDDLNTLLLMSVAHAKLRHSEAALRYFNEAVKAKPDSSNTYMVFAQAMADTGQKDMAISLLEKAIELDGKNALAYNALGIVYADKGELEKAKDVWSAGIKADPSSKEIAANLKRVSAMLSAAAELDERLKAINKLAGENNYEGAIAECKKALEAYPGSITIHNNLGVLYGMTGKDGEAVDEFKKVIKLSPKEGGAYRNIAIIYSKYPEKRDEAIKYFEKYILLNPTTQDRELVEKKIEELKNTR
jgi:tetratricopeptide (TPR) repeat protein